MGSIVCYHPDVKNNLFGKREKLIQKYTTESAEVTDAVAKKLSKLIVADLYGAVTGCSIARFTASKRHHFLVSLCGKKFISEKNCIWARRKCSEKKLSEQ